MHCAIDVVVMPKAGVNDPEGTAIFNGLVSLGLQGVEQVRAGRHFQLMIEAETETAAIEIATVASSLLLANPVIETFTVRAENRDTVAVLGDL